MIPKILLLFFVVLAANSDPCTKSRLSVRNLVQNTFEPEELPLDLLQLTEELEPENETLPLHNCSYLQSLKKYLDDNLKLNTKHHNVHRALFTYVQMKCDILYNGQYIPQTNSDVIFLTNSFATTGIKPVLERKLHLFFFHYGNWLELLLQRNFAFHKYTDPRFLLLDIICELINDSLYRLYEKEAVFFLMVNFHVCAFIKNNYVKTSHFIFNKKNLTANDNNDKHFMIEEHSIGNHIKLPFIFYDNGTSYNSNNSAHIILYQNITIRIMRDKIFSNASIVQLPHSMKIFIKAKGTDQSIKSTDTDQNSRDVTISLVGDESANSSKTLMLNHAHLTDFKLTPTLLPTETLLHSNISTPLSVVLNNKTRSNPSPYKVDIFKHFSSGHDNFTHFAPHQHFYENGTKHVYNLSVWDVVEMDGPCKEGQQHVVKLNVQSLLAAFDEHVSNASLELFIKLLGTVKSFPIEDYNARGDLLRDLIPAISKEQVDPVIKKTLDDILDRVILNGPGALPPKIKLECVDVPEETVKRTARKTKRINLQFI